MEWIKVEDRMPDVLKAGNNYNKSKKVIGLINGEEELILELNSGFDDDGYWQTWYCHAYDDCVSDVTHWCDCIPEKPKAI